MKAFFERLTGWMTLAAASCLFLSYLPAKLAPEARFTGAGMIGTICGLFLWRLMPVDPWRQVLIVLGGIAIALVVSDRAEVLMGRHDDPRIVIDEVVGMWVALLFLPQAPMFWAPAFILFRVFDVVKPGWIRRSASLPGGFGVVVDDLLAGAAANLIMQGLHLARVF
jgi:phosphatidylglycerophosphatase A